MLIRPGVGVGARDVRAVGWREGCDGEACDCDVVGGREEETEGDLLESLFKPSLNLRRACRNPVFFSGIVAVEVSFCAILCPLLCSSYLSYSQSNSSTNPHQTKTSPNPRLKCKSRKKDRKRTQQKNPKNQCPARSGGHPQARDIRLATCTAQASPVAHSRGPCVALRGRRAHVPGLHGVRAFIVCMCISFECEPKR